MRQRARTWTFDGYTGDIDRDVRPARGRLRADRRLRPGHLHVRRGRRRAPTPAPPAPREGLPLERRRRSSTAGATRTCTATRVRQADRGRPAVRDRGGLDERYAAGFGDLLDPRVRDRPGPEPRATSRTTRAACASSASATSGLTGGRPLHRRGRQQLLGRRAVHHRGGQRLIAASDRDYGLYIFRYTGPGRRPQPPTARAGDGSGRAADGEGHRSSRGSRCSPARSQKLSHAARQGALVHGSASTRRRSCRCHAARPLHEHAQARRARQGADARRTATVASVQANQTVTVTLRPSAALRRKLRSEKRLPALLSVEATDARRQRRRRGRRRSPSADRLTRVGGRGWSPPAAAAYHEPVRASSRSSCSPPSRRRSPCLPASAPRGLRALVLGRRHRQRSRRPTTATTTACATRGDNCTGASPTPIRSTATATAIGDACDDDDDNDDVVGSPTTTAGRSSNPDQANANRSTRCTATRACFDYGDGDGVIDAEDNCRRTVNPDQANNDGDGAGDVCDADDDNDGALDDADNCPRNVNKDQADADGDGIGNVCDPDTFAGPAFVGSDRLGRRRSVADRTPARGHAQARGRAARQRRARRDAGERALLGGVLGQRPADAQPRGAPSA